MDWLYLLIAGVFEIGWPVGLRMAQSSEKITGISIAVIYMAVSGAFLYMAQKTIPMGIAYAVWTGIGIAGTFLVGVMWFNEPNSLINYLGIALIFAGVIVLKFANSGV